MDVLDVRSAFCPTSTFSYTQPSMPLVTACPVCAGTQFTPYARSEPAPDRLHVTQVRCERCGLLISQPQASVEEMHAYYGRDYYREHWPEHEGLVRSNLANYRRWDWPVMQRLWADWPPAGGRAVEVGCGYGAMLSLLASEGFEVSGCDLSEDGVRVCRARGLNVVVGGVPGAPLAGPFDVTLTQHVIEHVPDPAAFLASLVAITAPGGLLVVVTEDAWNTQYAWERAWTRARGRTPAFRTSYDHTFVFSAPHLERLLRAAGCDDVRTATFSYVPADEAPHWRMYKGLFRTLDRLLGHGDYLMAVGRVGYR